MPKGEFYQQMRNKFSCGDRYYSVKVLLSPLQSFSSHNPSLFEKTDGSRCSVQRREVSEIWMVKKWQPSNFTYLKFKDFPHLYVHSEGA